MMLLLATIYDVPELNIGFHFYLKSDEDDEERKSLKPPGNSGESSPTSFLLNHYWLIWHKYQRAYTIINCDCRHWHC